MPCLSGHHKEVESFEQHYEGGRARKLPPRGKHGWCIAGLIKIKSNTLEKSHETGAVPSLNQHFETGGARKVPSRGEHPVVFKFLLCIGLN